MKDACYKKVKAQYEVFPSARASQAIAKCRKASGNVKKSEKGADLKRWQEEKWVDTKSGKACGAEKSLDADADNDRFRLFIDNHDNYNSIVTITGTYIVK